MPADPSTLAPVYAKNLANREGEFGPEDPRVARAASDLGLFLAQTGDASAAAAPLRKALAIDQSNAGTMLDFDRESLASVLESVGNRDEAISLLRQAAAGRDPKVAARSYARLAKLEPANSVEHLKRAVESEEKASGPADRRVAALLHGVGPRSPRKRR